MLRLGYVFAAMAAITAALLPFQWLAVKLGLPLRRRIPGLFHRMLCAILGVRVRVIGRRLPGHPRLIVGNHTSWLDPPGVTAVAPRVFVPQPEGAGCPLGGLRPGAAGAVFV